MEKVKEPKPTEVVDSMSPTQSPTYTIYTKKRTAGENQEIIKEDVEDEE
jgi:hypothetical protein